MLLAAALGDAERGCCSALLCSAHPLMPAAAVPAGAKPEREQVPGVKLKGDNKKPIVGLAVHPTGTRPQGGQGGAACLAELSTVAAMPVAVAGWRSSLPRQCMAAPHRADPDPLAADRGTLYVLLADGSLQVWVVQGAATATVSSQPVSPINAMGERVAVHAWAHPTLPGGALVAVEGSASGVSVYEAPPRAEPRLLGTLGFGPGSTICGVGLLASGLLCAAGRLPSGNVQVQAWELAGDGRELQVLPTLGAPGTLWDALQSMVGKAALAGGQAGGAAGWRCGAAPAVEGRVILC